jgi:hypothetical protein
MRDAVALQELLASRLGPERRLGHPVQWFAYPMGAENSHTADLVRRPGVSAGMSVVVSARMATPIGTFTKKIQSQPA